METKLPGYVTTAQCAESHGLTTDAIRIAASQGRLAAVKVGRDWFIRAEDCRAYIPAKTSAERGKRGGRPRKAREEASDGGE